MGYGQSTTKPDKTRENPRNLGFYVKHAQEDSNLRPVD